MIKIDENLQAIYSFEKKKKFRDSSDHISKLMFYSLRNESLKEINKLYEAVHFELLSSWAVIAFLRTAYPIKDKLSCWDRLYNTTVDILESENLDTRKELVGLSLKSK